MTPKVFDNRLGGGAFVVAAFVVVASCTSTTAPPDSPSDFESYAEECRAAMPTDAKFPETLDCLEGFRIPILYKGVEIPAVTAADSARFTKATQCDTPPLLPDVDDGGIGYCVPNSRFQTVPKELDKDAAYFAFLCRNYEYRSQDSQAAKPVYDDIALIVYNPVSGKSCFFQNLAKSLNRSPEVVIEPHPDGALPGQDIPFPFEEEADKFWLPPSKIRGLECVACHDANPFLRTPYIAQAKGAFELPTHTRSKKYEFVDAQFQTDWDPKRKFFDLKPKSGGSIGKCTVCHRVGVGGTSGFLTEYSTAQEDTPNQTSDLPFDRTHWMPTNADKDNWKKDFLTSVKMLLACHKDPDSSPDCKPTPVSE